MDEAARVEALLSQLTLDEKASLTAGADLWHTPPIARLGLPALVLSDGPSGARGTSLAEGPSSASFPCGTAIAATWNVELVERVGAAIAEDARTKGANVLLGPTMNLHRRRSVGGTSSATPRTRTSRRGPRWPSFAACRAAAWRPAPSTSRPTTPSSSA
jgi:beta-glucosidase-like glycosyl hydrolase